ncbi:MAG: hypothetical protein AB6733_18660 [Clostridiaceae bacterium]
MSYYIRKITRGKWPEDATEEIGKISADAITGCTRTTQNKLSLWKVENINKSIDDVIPIITGFDKPNRCEIVYIDGKELETAGIEIEKSSEDARTAIDSYKETHYNAIIKDLNGLGKFADVVLSSLKNFKRFTDGEVKKKLVSMISTGEVAKENLDQKLVEKITPRT